jgi:UDP-glucose 4-epimerase
MCVSVRYISLLSSHIIANIYINSLACSVAGSVNLMQVMSEYNCKKLVFSSSATVYGETDANPIKETEPLGATSPYGRSKLMVEDMLRDQCKADAEWGVAILRYFNPVGAHPSGLLGEDPKGIPNNLMPFITKVATGAQPELKIFGDDYSTKDGTGVRDYLHVMDLSQGHIAAIRALDDGLKGAEPFNLGTGIGVSVLEMVKAFGVARGEDIPYSIHPRRPGDVAACYADASKALGHLGWKAECTVEQMCRDILTWTRKNPDGFGSGAGKAAAGSINIKAPAPPLRSVVADTQRIAPAAVSGKKAMKVKA